MRKKADLIRELPPVTSLGDDELKHTVGTLLKLLRSKRGRAKLEWMVARIDGWRYAPEVDDGRKWWKWGKDMKSKLVASDHPEYLQDLNAVATLEAKLTERQQMMYMEMIWTVHYLHKGGCTATDVEVLMTSAQHRCVGLVAAYIEEFNRQYTQWKSRQHQRPQ